MSRKPIGGYFELELPARKATLYPTAYKYQSARAAFYALLIAGKPKKVWVPHYICNSMLDPLEKAGIEFSFYNITNNFEIDRKLILAEDEWLLYVNYFGICTQQQKQILKIFNPTQVIFDHSQSYFAKPLDCLATIYSLRKFFGVPDGGLLVTDLPIALPMETDEESVLRTTHLIQRLAGAPESGYAAYQAAEKSLENVMPKLMSSFTEILISSIDLESVRLRRNENFALLHAKLGHMNALSIDLTAIDGPLCYPFLTSIKGLRASLIKARVFVATYWPDVHIRSAQDSIERKLAENLIPIPCDQRYDQIDMRNIIGIITIEANL